MVEKNYTAEQKMAAIEYGSKRLLVPVFNHSRVRFLEKRAGINMTSPSKADVKAYRSLYKHSDEKSDEQLKVLMQFSAKAKENHVVEEVAGAAFFFRLAPEKSVAELRYLEKRTKKDAKKKARKAKK